MAVPDVAEADLFVYERSARHHHDNEDGEGTSPETGFKLMFIVMPERLGVRLRISDEASRGTLVADVAVIYDWARPATPEDDLDNFVINVGIPQVLNCASTVLMDVAASAKIPVRFYGYEAVGRLVDQFTRRPKGLADSLRQPKGAG